MDCCNNCRLVAKYLVDQKLDIGFATSYWCERCQIDFYNIDQIDIVEIANQ